ncbi:MAG: 30S ribosomal protein S30e [Thermoprotei archaeon]|nr:30S ribosomal protein S30e [TACK group archaeon]
MPSHGSVTKAGKVRQATPKVERMPHRDSVPRLKNRAKFLKRVVHAADKQYRPRR